MLREPYKKTAFKATGLGDEGESNGKEQKRHHRRGERIETFGKGAKRMDLESKGGKKGPWKGSGRGGSRTICPARKKAGQPSLIVLGAGKNDGKGKKVRKKQRRHGERGNKQSGYLRKKAREEPKAQKKEGTNGAR